ncbi:MAG: hypothetical protein SF069_17790 [Phycisphaerae bacterium]|nr:hypothetical protein [Phycisphaerae bacterium]
MKWRDIQAGLEMLPDDATRREVLAAAQRTATAEHSFPAVLLTAWMAAFGFLIAKVMAAAMGYSSRLGDILIILIWTGLSALFAEWWDRRPRHRAIVYQLFNHGIIVCSRCGYARRRPSENGLGRCSECGNDRL